MHSDIFVLFLDILGFSELVLNNEPKELKQVYDSEIHQTISASTLMAPAFFQSGETAKIISTREGKLVDVQQNQLNLHVMSDSLVAWTNSSDLDALKTISQFTAVYMSMTFILGLPHRGAISKGDIQLVNLPLNGNPQFNTVGSGVIRAHKYEYGQEWMGCVIDEYCFENFSNEQRYQCLSDHTYPIVNYDTPYKEDAKNRSSMVIDWTRFDMSIKEDIIDPA